VTAVRLRAALVAAVAAWAALLVVTPWLAGRPHASPIASGLMVAVYGIGSLVCHQLPQRSYYLWTAQMPVCARCAGIYAGAVIGAIAAILRPARRGWPGSVPGRDTRRAHDVRIVLALAAVPTLATLLYEWATGDMPAHAIRAASGVPLGLVVAWLVVAAADNQVN
jgi:hypothetical protein